MTETHNQDPLILADLTVDLTTMIGKTNLECQLQLKSKTAPKGCFILIGFTVVELAGNPF